MLSALLALLGSSAVGSIIGGIFAYLNQKQNNALVVQQLQHELALRDKDMALAKIEADGAFKMAQENTESHRFDALSDAYKSDTLDAALVEAIPDDSLKSSITRTEVLRRLIRPVLTVILVLSALYVNFVLIEQIVVVWPLLGKDQQFDLGVQAFAWVTGQASSAIGYWLVARGQSK